jgi:hypothetical protein
MGRHDRVWMLKVTQPLSSGHDFSDSLDEMNWTPFLDYLIRENPG